MAPSHNQPSIEAMQALERVRATDTRISEHEAVCADRYKALWGAIKDLQHALNRIFVGVLALCGTTILILLSLVAYLLDHGQPWK